MRKIVLLVLIVFVASCSVKTVKEEPQTAAQEKTAAADKEEKKIKRAAEKREKQKKELEQVRNEAQPIIDSILHSIKTINYETYIKDFDDSWKSANNDRNKFERINKDRKQKYGEPGARPIVKVKNDNPYYTLTYLVKFSKIEKPIPVIMSLKREDEKLKVAFLQYKFSVLKKKK